MTQVQPKTHWKSYQNPLYIGSYCFQPGEEITATIKKVKREIVVGVEGKKEECTVVHFVESIKPLILNATNAKTITKVAGTPYIEEWEGKRIVMGVEKVKAFGDVLDAVRVKKKQPAPIRAEAPIVCEDCHQPIKPWGNMTAQQVAASTRNRFGISVCFDCGQKRAETAKTVKNETTQTETIPADGGLDDADGTD